MCFIQSTQAKEVLKRETTKHIECTPLMFALLVLIQVELLCRSVVALVALEWLFTRVRVHVSSQLVLSPKPAAWQNQINRDKNILA